MDWSPEHDELLIREILTVEPYLHKPKTVKRGQTWTQLAEILNSIPNPSFRVNQRAVRDRWTFLKKAYSKKITTQEKGTGTNDPDPTEVEIGIADIIGKIESASTHWDDGDDKKKIEQERKNAEEVRAKCLETFSETKKRVSEDDESPKRKRSSGSETIAFLQSKLDNDAKFREQELQLRKMEGEQKRKAMELQEKMFADQQKLLAGILGQQQTVQQQQQQIILANMQAQQQQSQLLMALFEKLKKD